MDAVQLVSSYASVERFYACVSLQVAEKFAALVSGEVLPGTFLHYEEDTQESKKVYVVKMNALAYGRK